jgi:hypothetical protein
MRKLTLRNIDMQENNTQNSTRILGNTNARVLTATETEEVSGGRWWNTGRLTESVSGGNGNYYGDFSRERIWVY